MKLLTKIFVKIFANPVRKIRHCSEYLLTHPGKAPDHVILKTIKEPILYRKEAIAALQEMDFILPQSLPKLICFLYQEQIRYAWSFQYMNGQVFIILGSNQIIFAPHMVFDFNEVEDNAPFKLPLPKSRYYVVVYPNSNNTDICVDSIRDEKGSIFLAYSSSREPSWEHLCFRVDSPLRNQKPV